MAQSSQHIVIVVRIFVVVEINVFVVGDGKSFNVEGSSVLWFRTWLIIVALEPSHVSGEKFLKIVLWIYHAKPDKLWISDNPNHANKTNGGWFSNETMMLFLPIHLLYCNTLPIMILSRSLSGRIVVLPEYIIAYYHHDFG